MVRQVVLVSAILAATLARAASFDPVFTVPLGGDESDCRPLAIDGDTLVIGDGYSTVATLYDVRTGARRATATCPTPLPDDDEYCGCLVAVSRRIVALARGRGVDVFDRDGSFARRIDIEGLVGGIAVRGRRLLIGARRGSRPTLEAVAYLADAETGRVVRTFAVAAADVDTVRVALAGTSAVLAVVGAHAPGEVVAFDARTGRVRWRRMSPAPAPGDGFGAGLVAFGSDVVVAPGAYRLKGRTGMVRQTYRDPMDPPRPRFGRMLAASGNTVAIGDTEFPGPEGFGGAVHLYDARSGILLESVRHPPPSSDDFFPDAIAIDGPLVAMSTDTYTGSGLLWGLRRQP